MAPKARPVSKTKAPISRAIVEEDDNTVLERGTSAHVGNPEDPYAARMAALKKEMDDLKREQDAAEAKAKEERDRIAREKAEEDQREKDRVARKGKKRAATSDTEGSEAEPSSSKRAKHNAGINVPACERCTQKEIDCMKTGGPRARGCEGCTKSKVQCTLVGSGDQLAAGVSGIANALVPLKAFELEYNRHVSNEATYYQMRIDEAKRNEAFMKRIVRAKEAKVLALEDIAREMRLKRRFLTKGERAGTEEWTAESDGSVDGGPGKEKDRQPEGENEGGEIELTIQ